MFIQRLDILGFIALSIIIILSVVFGGTAQDITNYKQVIYIACIVLFGGYIFLTRSNSMPHGLHGPLMFISACIGMSLFYVLPLPSFIILNLPGRDIIAESLYLVETSPKFMAISMAPENTLTSLLNFLPLLMIILILSRMQLWYWIKTLVWIFPILAATLTILGVMQTENIIDIAPYKISNDGYPLGFFSNTNHLGTLLVMSLPLNLYLFYKMLNTQKYAPCGALGMIFLVTLYGIYAVHSTAAMFLLLVQISLLSIFLISTKLSGRIRLLTIGGLALFVGGFLYLGGFTVKISYRLTAGDETSRSTILQKSLMPLKEAFPVGTGLGTFADVYKVYETNGAETRKYANEVHNDYVQIILEMGIFGLLFILVFLCHYGWAIFKTLREETHNRYLRLAAANSMLFVLLHSAVDYPLRTSTIAVLFTFLSCILFGHWKEFTADQN